MKRSKGEKIFSVFNVIILSLVAVCCLLPVIHVFFASISDPILLSKHSGLVFKPLGKATLEGYRMTLETGYIVRGYLNTIFYVITATAIGMILNCFAAYGLSRSDLMLKGPITFLIAFTMLFNGGLIPTYLVIRNLKMLDTVWAIILPNCLSVFNIMIMRTSFKAIPDGLVEAAKLDGAGDFKILFSVVIPVSKSILAVVALFYIVQQWNSWFHTAIYVKNRDLYPLQLWLREIVMMNSTSALESAGEAAEMNLSRNLVKYATIMISIIPMMVVYPFVQKYFVTGVMIGSIKE